MEFAFSAGLNWALTRCGALPRVQFSSGWFSCAIVTCRLLQADELMQLLSCLSVLFQGACCLVQYVLVFFRLVVKCKVKCQFNVRGKKKKSMSAGGKGIWYPAQLCFPSVFLQESACSHASCSLPLPPAYNTLLPAYEAGCKRHTGQFAVVPEDSCSWSVAFSFFEGLFHPCNSFVKPRPSQQLAGRG